MRMPEEGLEPSRAGRGERESQGSLADQDLQQITHLMLLGQGVAERQLGLDLVAVPSALSLTHHVALVDQLGDDAVGGALGDPDGGGDVAQPNAGVTSNADQDVRVVGQEVPAGGGLLRVLRCCHIGKVFHELVVVCLYGYATHQDSSGVADASRVTDPIGFADPAPINLAGGDPTTGGKKMSDATNEPVSGYDSLKTKKVIASLSSRSQVELAKIESYEHTHQNRVSVFDKLRWLRQDEPLPDYDSLSSSEVLATLKGADLAALKRVRGYERRFHARREILDEVDRLHRERRLPLVSRDTQR
jgi:hypothetical protein